MALVDDSRFGVAVHALTLMACLDRPLPSEFVAASINTNPAWIRESMKALREAGLVRSVRGPGGGLLLAKPAAEITLADIWEVTSGGRSRPAHLATVPDARCVVGSRIVGALDDLSDRIAGSVQHELESTTLAEWAEQFETGNLR